MVEAVWGRLLPISRRHQRDLGEWFRWLLRVVAVLRWAAALAVCFLMGWGITTEIRTSYLQSRLLSRWPRTSGKTCRSSRLAKTGRRRRTALNRRPARMFHGVLWRAPSLSVDCGHRISAILNDAASSTPPTVGFGATSSLALFRRRSLHITHSGRSPWQRESLTFADLLRLGKPTNIRHLWW